MKAMAQSLNFGKSVSDNGWGTFVTFLGYKLDNMGKKLIKVDKFFASSQVCNVCGYKRNEKFICQRVGLSQMWYPP
ncbi:MAG: transposase [Allobaculum sp.]|nr:transposase [Allobaculum sp.]